VLYVIIIYPSLYFIRPDSPATRIRFHPPFVGLMTGITEQ